MDAVNRTASRNAWRRGSRPPRRSPLRDGRRLLQFHDGRAAAAGPLLLRRELRAPCPDQGCLRPREPLPPQRKHRAYRFLMSLEIARSESAAPPGIAQELVTLDRADGVDEQRQLCPFWTNPWSFRFRRGAAITASAANPNHLAACGDNLSHAPARRRRGCSAPSTATLSPPRAPDAKSRRRACHLRVRLCGGSDRR